MKNFSYFIILFSLVCIANCSKSVNSQLASLKSGTEIDGYIYEGGPVSSSFNWTKSSELEKRLLKDGKVLGSRYTSAVTGAQYFSLGNGWRLVSNDDEKVSSSQRGSILLVIGSTVRAATDMDRFEMWPGNPLIRNGFSDRSKFAAMIKDYKSGMGAIHKGGGVDTEASSEMIKASLPFSFDSDDVLQSKSEKRHRLLNAAASSIGRPNPFVVQSFMTKIESQAISQSQSSPLQSQTKAPTPP